MFVNSPQFDVLWFASTMSVGGPEMKFVARGAVNVMGKPRTVETALELGERFLGGQGYKEIDNGVFRSLDGLRQFRVTPSDLAGKGMKGVPHVHYEWINPLTDKAIKNYHVPLLGY
jgi:hypothetical protein